MARERKRMEIREVPAPDFGSVTRGYSGASGQGCLACWQVYLGELRGRNVMAELSKPFTIADTIPPI